MEEQKSNETELTETSEAQEVTAEDPTSNFTDVGETQEAVLEEPEVSIMDDDEVPLEVAAAPLDGPVDDVEAVAAPPPEDSLTADVEVQEEAAELLEDSLVADDEAVAEAAEPLVDSLTADVEVQEEAVELLEDSLVADDEAVAEAAEPPVDSLTADVEVQEKAAELLEDSLVADDKAVAEAAEPLVDSPTDVVQVLEEAAEPPEDSLVADDEAVAGAAGPPADSPTEVAQVPEEATEPSAVASEVPAVDEGPSVSGVVGVTEAEKEAADHPMNDLLEDALSLRKLRQGDIVDGQIVSVSPTEILVDVGAKSEGVVRGKELESLGRQGLEGFQVGDSLPVYVVRPEDRDGTLILSIRRAEEEHDWRRAQKLYEDGEAIETHVAGFNKGGLIVRLGKLRGFVPASQLSRQHQGKQNQQPEERWSRLVGTPTRVKVIEINRKRKRLIMSERAALREWREAQKETLLEDLREGEVRTGIVSSLSDFGAFVDLGGADGLVHLSELSWNRAAKPADVLTVGQEVEVYVLGVNREKKRIALSLKRLEPEPWSTVESRFYVGQLVEGSITRLTSFGAFALINDEIEGLLHISELSDRRINHPQEVVKEGEKHVMRIIRIDPKRRRMGLSLTRVADPEYADLDWRAELAQAEAALDQEESQAETS